MIFIANRGRAVFIEPTMTKKTKEAIKATSAIIIVVVAVLALWIYPLNQAGKIVRPDEIQADSTATETGPVGDSIHIITEDNLNLVGQVFNPAPGGTDSTVKGTFILLHGLFDGAASQLAKVQVLLDRGYRVITYDQRGFGRSDGDFTSGGYFEGNDLQSVVSRMDLENRLTHPVTVWGEDYGGTAAVRAWAIEDRIDFVVGENPVVNGRDWQKRIIRRRDLSAPDLLLPVVWWWMKLKTSYEISNDESDFSDEFGVVTEKYHHRQRLLVIAGGDNETPANPYLAEMQQLGGYWMIVPESKYLFPDNRQAILDRIQRLLALPPSIEGNQ